MFYGLYYFIRFQTAPYYSKKGYESIIKFFRGRRFKTLIQFKSILSWGTIYTLSILQPNTTEVLSTFFLLQMKFYPLTFGSFPWCFFCIDFPSSCKIIVKSDLLYKAVTILLHLVWDANTVDLQWLNVALPLYLESTEALKSKSLLL